MHQVQVDIVNSQTLERAVDAFSNPVVPGVVELGGDPDLTARNTRFLDAFTNLGFIAVCESTKWVICQLNPSPGGANPKASLVTHVSIWR